MLTADELAKWRETLRVWESVRDVGELAEIMAALAPEERQQIWSLTPKAAAVRAEVEKVLSTIP